ncbi:MAG: alpha/beta fold hydrolase [Hyphomicrobium sp.]
MKPLRQTQAAAFVANALLIVCITVAALASGAAASPNAVEVTGAAPQVHVTHYRRTIVDGVGVFYREAGPPDAPVVVLLHGFPTSSRMFRNLIPALSDRYRVIAPDYPGFGHSDVPDRKSFGYSFAKFADIMDGLLGQIGVKRYALYVMDYGAPVGFRLALKHPDRVSALVVQNGNAYEEGLKAFWDPIKSYWADGSIKNREALRAGLTAAATKSQYLDGVADPSRIDPDNWLVDQALLDRPGNAEIQLDLFKDYGSNVALYPKFQTYFRMSKPPTLIVWGKNDVIFPAEGAHPYKRDLPNAEVHLLDTGHFALEDKGEDMAALMRDFLDRKLARD